MRIMKTCGAARSSAIESLARSEAGGDNQAGRNVALYNPRQLAIAVASRDSHVNITRTLTEKKPFHDIP